MKFTTHNELASFSTDGTSQVGLIDARYTNIVDAFGEPLTDVDEYKSHFEWEIQFEDGTVATLYDWKEEAPFLPDDVITWHIGGHPENKEQIANLVERIKLAVQGPLITDPLVLPSPK